MAGRLGRPDSNLGTVLRRIREARGDTLEEIAFQAGVTANTLARIERGQSDPAWSTVRSLAATLGISMRDLAGRIEREERG